MSELWKRWEGQVIDHKYQLRQFLGSTDHSTVFCAEFRDPELRNAAIKFLAADLPHSDQVLDDWKMAQQLSHPNLLTIYSVGRCSIEEMDLIYVATEYADENLGEILPHRALTSEEAREMLSVVVEALVYLHVKNLTHGHVKPSNILAIGERLKLTSDTIERLAEAREMRRKRDVYDAPEIPATAYTPAADVWSLGVTLVEALTQQPVFLPFNENAEPVIPATLREPFREIASQVLKRDPNARWSSLDIAARLNPQAAEKLRAAIAAAAKANPEAAAAMASPIVAAVSNAEAGVATGTAAGAAAGSTGGTLMGARPGGTTSSSEQVTLVPPLSVPLSKEPAVPLGKAMAPKVVVPRPPMPPPPVSTRPPSASREAILLPNWALPLLAAVLILAAIIVLPKMLRRGTQQAASTSAPAPVVRKPPAAERAPDPAPVSTSKDSGKSEPSGNTKPSAAGNSAEPTTHAAAVAPTPAPAVVHNSNSSALPSPKKAASSPERGEVLDQILPRPSSSALGSIEGTVRVVVRVHVDSSGNVTRATLEKPGPSKYFAEKSLEASRGWVFLSPAPSGRSEESEWLLRFDFTHSGVNAFPTQAKP